MSDRIDIIKGKAERNLTIVKGYHDFIQPPEIVYDKKLFSRVAIVLSTYRHDKKYSYFDAELFFELISKIRNLFSSCQLNIYFTDECFLNSIDSMKERVLSESEEDRNPPRSIIFRINESVCCVIDLEFWVNVGGPLPYHDSYTIAVYTSNDISEQLIVICNDVCNALSATICGITEISPLPKRSRKWLWGFLSKLW